MNAAAGVRLMATASGIASLPHTSGVRGVAAGLRALRQWYLRSLAPAAHAQFSSNSSPVVASNAQPTDATAEHAAAEHAADEPDRAIKRTLDHFRTQAEAPAGVKWVDATLQAFAWDADHAESDAETGASHVQEQWAGLAGSMRDLIKRKQFSAAYVLFDRQKSTAGPSAWAKALQISVIVKDWGRLERDWADLKRHPVVRPTWLAYFQVMRARATCKDLDKLRRDYEEMLASGLTPNVVHLTLLAATHASTGDLARAHSYLAEMARRRIQPTPATVWMLVRSFGRSGHEAEMFTVFDSYRRAGHRDNYTGRIYNEILGFYGRLGRLEEMEAVFGEMNEAGLLHASSVAIVLDALLHHGRRELVRPLLLAMQEKGIPLDYQLYTVLFEHAARAGDAPKMRALWLAMRADGIAPDSTLLKIVLNGAISASDLNTLRFFFWDTHATKRGCDGYRLYIEGHERFGVWHHADKGRRLMEQLGLEPHYSKYHAKRWHGVGPPRWPYDSLAVVVDTAGNEEEPSEASVLESEWRPDTYSSLFVAADDEVRT